MTTSDKDGENSTFDKHLVDAEVIITTPYASPNKFRYRPPLDIPAKILEDMD